MTCKPLLIAAFASLLSLAAVAAHASFIQLGGKLVGTGAVGSADQGFAVAISADGNTAIVGGDLDDGHLGAAWVFVRSGGAWVQQGPKLVATDPTFHPFLGSSVALSADGNTALVGGINDNHDVGAAWVFVRSGGVWTQQGPKLVDPDAVGEARQGASVALSADGNTALVGQYGDRDGGLRVGAARVYTRSGGVWSRDARLSGTGAVGEAFQGYSVALSADGNTALLGGRIDDNDKGAAWVFTRSGGTWTQQGSKLVGTGATAISFQGSSVALSADGNTAIVGAWADNGDVGAAWMYTRSGVVWSQQGPKLVGAGAVGVGYQGISVALSGDGNIAVVGGGIDNSLVGATWVYTRSSGVWTQLGPKLVGAGAVGTAQQGTSVAISGDGNTVMVGGLADDNNAGAVWMFTNPLTTNCRFASAVVSFSSEFPSQPATQALGLPNWYPSYGESPFVWSSLSANQPEFLDLGFTAPERINFVNVYETLAPGAIQSISVKNPYTGLFEAVWTGTPAAAPGVSRLFTATFPPPPFPVNEIRIDLASDVVPGFNEIDAVGIGYRDLTTSNQWASSVVSFSSQYNLSGAPNWYAEQALGPPDLYPSYGDVQLAWASLTADDQREFLDLAFATPSPISFVNVVETYNPGALDKVSVKNPNTGLFEEVWSGTAAAAPPLARFHTVSFPETRFLVSEVRLDFNSPVVPDWNEIDAVGIGRCACLPSPVDVPAPTGASVANAIEWARPNPFSVSTGILFSLARAGKVKIEVFNVAGQRVAQLMDRPLPAGRHDARWDGRDANGRSVASGIYYLRLDSADLRGTRKVVKFD